MTLTSSFLTSAHFGGDRRRGPWCLAAIAVPVILGTTMAAAPSVAAEPEAPKTNTAADPAQTTYRCVQAFTAGQKLKANEKLLAARAEFRECAQEACPELTRKPCGDWLEELKILVPTISISATQADGSNISPLRVTLDGSLSLGEVDDTPIEVDPGQHRVKVEAVGFPPEEQSFDVAAGTHELPLRFRFGTPAEAPGEEQGTSAAAAIGWTGVALAAAGLIVGAITGGVAMSNKAALEDDCAAGACTQEEIDDGAVPATISTAGFIVAGVGALAAIIGFAVDLSADGAAPSEEGASAILVGPGNLAWRVRFP